MLWTHIGPLIIETDHFLFICWVSMGLALTALNQALLGGLPVSLAVEWIYQTLTFFTICWSNVAVPRLKKNSTEILIVVLVVWSQGPYLEFILSPCWQSGIPLISSFDDWGKSASGGFSSLLSLHSRGHSGSVSAGAAYLTCAPEG